MHVPPYDDQFKDAESKVNLNFNLLEHVDASATDAQSILKSQPSVNKPFTFDNRTDAIDGFIP